MKSPDCGGLARGFLVDREFGDADALIPKRLSHLGAFVVMRQHADAGRSRHPGQPCDRCRDVVTAGHHARHQTIECVVRKAGAFDHAAALLRLGQAGDGGIHVVVEREQIDPSVGQPLADFGFGIEVVGLMAQVEAGVRRQLRPQGLDGLEQLPCIVRAAQPRLPRPGRGVKHRGDAVGDRLPVAVDQRHIDGKIDAGARHHLPLERVAVQIDDARQHLQAAGIDAERHRAHGPSPRR